MSYSAEISEDNPSCFLFLIDQSGSMQEQIAGSANKRKADSVADVINRVLQNFSIKCARSDGIRDYLEIGVIGYGATVKSAFSGALAGRSLVPISEIANNPARIEERTEKADDGESGLVDQTVKFPIWIEPVTSAATPMCQALGQAHQLLKDWVAKHPSSYPPIVVNITDGEATDGDPSPHAKRISDLATGDGNILVFNCHVSRCEGQPIVFPNDTSSLPDEYAQILFRMSSILPPHLRNAARSEGLLLGDQARCFAYNVDLRELIRFLDVGTRLLDIGTRSREIDGTPVSGVKSIEELGYEAPPSSSENRTGIEDRAMMSRPGIELELRKPLLKVSKLAEQGDWDAAADLLRQSLDRADGSEREILSKHLSSLLANRAINNANNAIEAIDANDGLTSILLDQIKSAERGLEEAVRLDLLNDQAVNSLNRIRGLLKLLSKAALTSRQGTPEVPGGVTDKVHFSVTSPEMVIPGMSFVLDVWAHLERQREEVIKRAREATAGGEIYIQSKGPVAVSRGTILTVRLRLEELLVEESEDTILWEGEIGNATFVVRVPKKAIEGSRQGLATIHADGWQIARINFSIHVGKKRWFSSRRKHDRGDTIPAQTVRHREAFASYSSADRDAVLARIQGIQKAAPQLNIFLDVLSLRSGQDWEQELWRRIPASDVFYLFWSGNARDSEWVRKEWQCALKTRGIGFIDPVPLVSPKLAPPPPELASKHFDDWALTFMSDKTFEKGSR